MTSRIIRTESGSTYEAEGSHIRRHNAEWGLRQDDEWVRLFAPLPEENLVGRSVTFLLEPLGDGIVTARMTSTVIADTWEAA